MRSGYLTTLANRLGLGHDQLVEKLGCINVPFRTIRRARDLFWSGPSFLHGVCVGAPTRSSLRHVAPTFPVP